MKKTNNDVEEGKIYKALTDAGIPFEVLRTEDGWLEIGFCIKEFNRGKFEDWQVEFIDTKHYAIFHKEVSQEWQNEEGNNLCFETKKEAVAYLKKEFGKEMV